MLFYSTNLIAAPVPFNDALLKGLAPDKGLYMPEYIPRLEKEEILAFTDMEYPEIAFRIARKFLQGVISDEELLTITRDAYDYEVPLEHVVDRKYVMRLDQGPTASFKDFAARMMGRLMQHYLNHGKRKLLILT
ncbi:MAG: threonine synthase, partial [Bacteroidetes bacterium]